MTGNRLNLGFRDWLCGVESAYCRGRLDVTRQSQSAASYERATVFEVLRGKIITLAKSEYREPLAT